MRNQSPRFLALQIILFTTVAFALVPGDLHHEDVLLAALYHTENFQGEAAYVPHTLTDAAANLQSQIQKTPSNAALYKALAEINTQQLDHESAERNMRLYLEKATVKDEAYRDLQNYYHERPAFDKELAAMKEHAASTPAGSADVSVKTGRYAIYQQMLTHISTYGLMEKPETIYQAAIDSYPQEKKPYLETIGHLKNTNKALAFATLVRFKAAFPDDVQTYLLTRASLVSNEEAYQLLNQSYDPLWNQDLLKAFDSTTVSTGKKREYLISLQNRLLANPLDFDAVTRLFHAFYLAANLIDAQNTLNDFRLLKEQSVQSKNGAWTAGELHVMALLNHTLLNFNEAARYYYALYNRLNHKPESGLSKDFALKGLFEILLAAEDRPLQLGAGNLDYYKDIAAVDRNPGVLNGILSLILNGTDPVGEFDTQQDRALGYFNRAEALRLLRLTQREVPSSPYLPGMYRDALKIYEKYGMDDLLIEAGEEFFTAYRDSKEILDVGIAVADAYARQKKYDQEWKTYRFLLPIAAARGPLFAPEVQTDSWEDEYTQQQNKSPYESLLSRTIASLTNQENHLEVVRLYKQEMEQHPDEQTLYENFAAYLNQNQLFDEEKQVYQQAINRFQGRNWYEKLARWYLRFKRNSEYEELSQKLMDIFRGTEIESYLSETGAGSDPSLYLALNRFAHTKFPLNIAFTSNLLTEYSREHNWKEWESLAAQYYFIDESIRNRYLEFLSWQKRLPATVDSSNTVHLHFSADIAVWRSHFEESVPLYQQLSGSHPSDTSINTRLADLKRSLGVQNAEYYRESAAIREHLARITPSDSALWTAAGDTLADVELYSEAGEYWDRILQIEPHGPDRYIEVATIYWDYYLFDRALNTIIRIRELKKDRSLFAYEAGAVHESKRDYRKAIAEYALSLTDHSEMAWNRLSQLYDRTKYTDMVRSRIEEQLHLNPQDEKLWLGAIRFYADRREKEMVRQLLERATATLSGEVFRNSAESLKQSAADQGFAGIQESVIRRQMRDAATDLERWNRMLDLARLFESLRAAAKAEAVYRELYTLQPRSAGIINELLSYYWRSTEYEKAFALYQEVLPAANIHWKKKYLVALAGKYRERKLLSPALLAARELYSGEPFNDQHFRLVAEILAEQKDYASMAQHYKDGLQKVRESTLNDAEKKAGIAALRRGMIEAQVILQDYTAALDQYIEIINREAESEEVLKEAAAFASRYGLMDRLFEYYTKTAAGSAKDHRWPMVLGRLRVYSGKFEEAIVNFRAAIEIRPERTDFYRQVAESYQRLGKYQEAIQEYEKIYSLSYKNKQWLQPMAELYARLGNGKKALQLYQETLGELIPIEKDFQLCSQALQWGMAEQATVYGKAAMNKYSHDLKDELSSAGFGDYIEAIVRSGRGLEAFGVLLETYGLISSTLGRATFESENLRSAQYIVRETMTTRFPALMQKYFTTDDFQQVEAALFQRIATAGGYAGPNPQTIQIYLSMVRSARMAPAEERLLRDLANHYDKLARNISDPDWRNYRNWHEQVVSFYRQRQAYAQAGDWMEAQWRKYRWPSDYREELPEAADFFRLDGNTDKELSMLRNYYRFGVKHELSPEPVERYLDLLYAGNKEDEIKQAAATANLIAANYFVAKKDKGMAVLAVASLHSRLQKEPAWQTIQLAILGHELRDPADLFDGHFKIGLEIKTIGGLLEPNRDITKTVEGDDWFYYGRKYGEYLQWINRREEAAFYLASDLEGLSTSPDRHSEVARYYAEEKQIDSAIAHYRLALQLDPRILKIRDDLAQTLVQAGFKDEAIMIWKQMIKDNPDSFYAWKLLLEAAVAHNFLEPDRKTIEEFLSAKVRKAGASGIAGMLPVYLKTLSDPNHLMLEWIRSAPAPKEFGRSLLGLKLGAATNLLVFETVEDYLKNRMLTASGQEQSSVKSEWVEWSRYYTKELRNQKQHDRALQVLNGVEDRLQADQDRWRRRDVVLLKIEILSEQSRNDEAVQLIKSYVAPEEPAQESEYSNEGQDERYRKALESVGGNQTLENFVNQQLYEWFLANGRKENAVYAGLAEIKLNQGQSDEAGALLQKMIYLDSENLEGFHAAAEVMEKLKRWEEATGYRLELAKRKSWDFANRARLGDDLLKLNRKTEATKEALSVLGSAFASATDRALAAKVNARAGTLTTGPPEMIAIQNALRSGQPQADSPYSHNYRAVLLETNDPPPLDLIQREWFLNPSDQSSQIRLFHAFARDGKYDQALATLDPDKQRHSNYEPDPEEWMQGEYYYAHYDHYNTYPVEGLNLTEEETRTIALEMAECAEKTGDRAGKLFFLKMAVHHTVGPAPEQEKRITELMTGMERDQQEENRRVRIGLNLGRNQ